MFQELFVSSNKTDFCFLLILPKFQLINPIPFYLWSEIVFNYQFQSNVVLVLAAQYFDTLKVGGKGRKSCLNFDGVMCSDVIFLYFFYLTWVSLKCRMHQIHSLSWSFQHPVYHINWPQKYYAFSWQAWNISVWWPGTKMETMWCAI